MARILIVDDQLGVGKRVSKAMTAAGYRTSAIDDAALALEHIRQHPPDIVLIGSLSERIDSLKLLADIKREHPKIPILAYAIKRFDAMDSLMEATTGLLGENNRVNRKNKIRSDR